MIPYVFVAVHFCPKARAWSRFFHQGKLSKGLRWKSGFQRWKGASQCPIGAWSCIYINVVYIYIYTRWYMSRPWIYIYYVHKTYTCEYVSIISWECIFEITYVYLFLRIAISRKIGTTCKRTVNTKNLTLRELRLYLKNIDSIQIHCFRIQAKFSQQMPRVPNLYTHIAICVVKTHLPS